MSQDHHIIPRQRIKIAVSSMAVKDKQGREPLSDSERRLLTTPLTTILRDRRNIVRLSNARHHRAHNGVRPFRLKRSQLPDEIDAFAADYALEWALERELALIDGETSGPEYPD